MADTSDKMKEMFDIFAKDFEEEHTLREEIRAFSRELENCQREMLAILQRTHSQPSEKNAEDLAAVRAIIDGKVKTLYKEIAFKISPNIFYKYHDHFRYSTQRISFVIAFAQFLENGTLVDRNETAERLDLNVDASKGFHLDIEDYLMGLLLLASELSRYSVNSVVSGDYSRSFQIADFIRDIDTKFRLLNLKNDLLRKKYDALKYDVQKCENVIYDLKIRGLKPAGDVQSVIVDVDAPKSSNE